MDANAPQVSSAMDTIARSATRYVKIFGYRACSVFDVHRPAGFLDLPREIRDHCYHFMCGGETIQISLFVNRDRAKHKLPTRLSSVMVLDRDVRARKRKKVDADLLVVSRTFSAEAKEIIYKTNTFQFEEPSALRAFVNRVPDSSLELIRFLQLNLQIPMRTMRYSVHAMISSCVIPRMRGLVHLDVEVMLYRSCWDLPLRRPDLVITEGIHSSYTLPRLECANLELYVSRSTVREESLERAKAELHEVRMLITGSYA